MSSNIPRLKPGKVLLLALAAMVAASYGVYYLKYWFSYSSDLKSRRWAYSKEAGAKLLVGKWQGTFTDPGGVEKRIELEIFEPVSQEEREKKATLRTKNRKGLVSKDDKLSFDGTAKITSRLGAEDYDIQGAVGKADFHQLGFDFIAVDEKNRLFPNYTARTARPGTWQGDELSLTVGFIQYHEDGSSTSSSEGVVVNGQIEWKESAEDAKVLVNLKRAGS